MDYYPAFLDLDGRPVLVVGGGDVAARKARSLLDAGAQLTVIAPAVTAELQALAATGEIGVALRPFSASDVEGHWLVINATDDPRVAADVARAAETARVFCNSVDDVKRCSFIVPAVVDRRPVMVAISSGGQAPVLARRLRARIEALLPPHLGQVAALAGRWRKRVAATLSRPTSRRRFWERIFDGRLDAAWQAGGIAAAEGVLATELYDAGPAKQGMAWLVGAGPGDPGLLTLKALQALEQADVVLHDRLVPDAIMAFARRDAVCISVGKSPGRCGNSQEEINTRLVGLVREGKRVCRLKGGDPFVFGRGGEEAAALEAAGLPCVVIPGITAALGCAAAAGIPLTHRDIAQSLTLVTGHGKDADEPADWATLARGRQTLAIYMGVSRCPDIMRQLTQHGRPPDTPVAIIEAGTLPEQRVLRGTLGQLSLLAQAHRVRAPAMLIVGDVARLGVSRSEDAPTGPGHWNETRNTAINALR